MIRKEIRRDAKEYFKSIGKEIYVSRNRVRNLIGRKHWLSDGEWKENILRSVLQRHLPPRYMTGKGFFISDRHSSGQTDILIYDSRAPMLYRDGDFMIVQARFVRGVIEVKTRNDISQFQKTTEKFCKSARSASAFFRGIFIYEFPSCDLQKVLPTIQKYCDRYATLINAVCCGKDVFIKYHIHNPTGDWGEHYDKWHGYEAKDLSFGLFVSSVIEAICSYETDLDQTLWGLSEIEEYKVADQRRFLASDN